ncbi:hypothetical protein GYK42_26375, partial [Janthinobacterium lividum]|nr:hypothetical protein [Janthinobacterium lividum]
MFGLITLFIVGLLITAFVQVLQYRRKVADLELLTARLRKEVDGIQQRLLTLEGQDGAPAASPVVPAAVAPVLAPVSPPAPVQVPQAAVIEPVALAKVAPAAPVPPKPVPPT